MKENKIFKSSEEAISMFLGLVIVLVVVGLIFNFFQKRRGDVVVPGSSDVAMDDSVGEGGVSENMQADVYIVRAGDSLWKIAQRELGDGYAWVDIADKNQVDNPGLIVVGQKLIMPEMSEIEKESETVSVPDNYVVKAGDNLWKISVAVYGDGYAWPQVWQANMDKLNSPDLLEVGMVLTMPKIDR